MKAPPYPDGVSRFEWVKMFYPDSKKGIVVGIVHLAMFPDGAGWVFDHRTDDSQNSPDGPMGLDVGTLRYLESLQPAVREVHFLPIGSPVLLTAPLPEFGKVGYRPAVLSSGGLRTRIFLPIDKWTPWKVYPEMRPDYWAVTHLKEDGSVIVRHAPHPS